MSMRTWNDKLYLDAMPGRQKTGRPQGDFPGWLREMQENGIRTVVCLAPEEQIARESKEYEAWRQAELGGRGGFELIDVPIDDYHAPEPPVATRFWEAAGEIAERIENKERVFVHCGAGIGRTGMFAVGVLMQQGYDYEKAYREVQAVGSHPEVPAQREFLQRGPGFTD